MTTILAVHPNTNLMGYAVFEGAELIDWGVKSLGAPLPIRERITKKAVPYFDSLVYRYEPDIVVLPDATKVSTSRGFFVQSISLDSARRSFRVETVTRKDIQTCFKTLIESRRANKEVIMQVLVRWFPELRGSLPRRRRIWESQDYWVPMFDAVALAITWLNRQQ